MKKIVRVLGIESSCDECSFAIVDMGVNCLAMQTYTQLEEHANYGGVVPELASRLHVKYISKIYKKLLEGGLGAEKRVLHEQSIDAIAVTTGPGLSGSLMVGLHFAKALSLCLKIPFVGVDHIAAHFYSSRIKDYTSNEQNNDHNSKDDNKIYPYIGVVVSGGHTVFAVVHDYDDIEVKGSTIDDACGEVFDKIARELKLGYPGGVIIDTLSKHGDLAAAQFPQYKPKNKNEYNVSYSGLKTAVIHHRTKYWNNEFAQSVENIAATFTHAAITMLTDRVCDLARDTGIYKICFGGGVSCNSYLRKKMNEKMQGNKNARVIFPPQKMCVDNAAMIAGLGYHYVSKGTVSTYDLGVQARINLYRKNTQ